MVEGVRRQTLRLCRRSAQFVLSFLSTFVHPLNVGWHV